MDFCLETTILYIIISQGSTLRHGIKLLDCVRGQGLFALPPMWATNQYLKRMKQKQRKSDKLKIWKEWLEVAEKLLTVAEKIWPTFKSIVGILLTIVPMIASWFMDN